MAIKHTRPRVVGDADPYNGAYGLSLIVGRHAPMPPRGVVRFPGWPGGSRKVRRGEGTPPYGAGIRFVTVVGGGVLDAPHGCYGTPWAAIYGFRAS